MKAASTDESAAQRQPARPGRPMTPRAGLLLDLVRAGAQGDQPMFRRTLEAMVAEERAKQHHVLAEQLAAHLRASPSGPETMLPLRRPNGQPDPVVPVHPRRRLAELILPAEVLAACKELIEEHERAELLRAHNLEPRHRVVLAGPPGNGKTSLAEALATELAVPLLVVRYEAVITSYLGETALRLSRLFDQVRTQRCVLFFDEFDVVGKERGDEHETGEIKRVVSSLLLQVDALPSHVVIVTATNHPELLDRAAWRRFQLRLELPAPRAADVSQWLRAFELRLGRSLGAPVGQLSKRLEGMSFSDLEQFGEDILRRVVLQGERAQVASIVRDRLSQWARRYRGRENGGRTKRKA